MTSVYYPLKSADGTTPGYLLVIIPFYLLSRMPLLVCTANSQKFFRIPCRSMWYVGITKSVLKLVYGSLLVM